MTPTHNICPKCYTFIDPSVIYVEADKIYEILEHRILYIKFKCVKCYYPLEIMTFSYLSAITKHNACLIDHQYNLFEMFNNMIDYYLTFRTWFLNNLTFNIPDWLPLANEIKLLIKLKL